MLAVLRERCTPVGMAASAGAEVVYLMPVIREPLSISQLAGLLGVEPERLIDVEVNLLKNTANLVLQPEAKDEKAA